MNLFLNRALASTYSSKSQMVRVMSEAWLEKEIYCPSCCAPRIVRHPNNMPAADFYCSQCFENYELKSTQRRGAKKIPDGAYSAMQGRIASGQSSSLFMLNYDLQKMTVTNLFVVPNHFIVQGIIEKRKPLASTARRSGWVGCNIVLERIPEAGRIHIIKDGFALEHSHVCKAWERTCFLQDVTQPQSRGWLLDVMLCIDKINKETFRLCQIYDFEGYLTRLHPNNAHIRQKIRQQLQVLRDVGYLDFVERGSYRVNRSMSDAKTLC